MTSQTTVIAEGYSVYPDPDTLAMEQYFFLPLKLEGKSDKVAQFLCMHIKKKKKPVLNGFLRLHHLTGEIVSFVIYD